MHVPRSFNPRFFDVTVHVAELTLRVFISDNICVTASETYSVPHNHQEQELRYFESGTSCYMVGGSKYMCGPGDYLLIPPGVFHAQLDADNPGSLADCVQYNLRFSVCAAAQPEVDAYLRSVRLVHTHRGCTEALLRVLTQEIYDKRPGFLTAAKGILTALLTRILRPANSAGRLFSEKALQYHNHLRMAIDQYFMYNYLEQLSVSGLARELNLPVRQVQQAMQEIYGMPFSHKLREMRVEAAKVLLRTTTQDVTHIAAACGFDTYSYFYTSFKKHEGCGPQEYRRRHQTNI